MADMQSVKDDIAFMRALAQEGQTAPLLGGGIMIAAGAVFGGASLVHYLIAAGIVVASPWAFPVLWLGAGVVFTVILQMLKARYRGRIGSGSPGNRAQRAVWRSVGWAIATFFAAFAVASWKLNSPAVFAMFPAAVLALYGAAWCVAAQMFQKRWMSAIGGLSFGLAVAVCVFIGSADLYLAYAVSLALTAILPGVLIMRQEPSDIV